MKAEGPAAYIHEGFWTNWQKGSVWGSTLTVNQSQAAIVSPALAILVSIAGGQLWRLFQYALHQARATSSPSDFLYHQQQVSLRNTTSDLNTLWRLLRLSIAWRHQRDMHSLRRSLPLILWSLLHLVLIILAGLFSSKLLSGGDQVLSRSPWCGWYSSTYVSEVLSTTPTDELIHIAMEYENNLNSIYASIQQHVDICSTSVDGCNDLLPNALAFTSQITSKSCPFDSAVCHPNTTSISFDTGFLSSQLDFGLNAIKKDRVAIRLLAQCSPLNDAQYVSEWETVNATADEPAYQVADARYGPSKVSARNASFSAVKQYEECDQRRVTPPYVLSAQWAGPGGSTKAGTATFNPIPQLRSANADTGIIMLSFNGAFYGPVSDPWFSSNQVLNETNAFCSHENRTLYTRDLPITTIGCLQQFQICNKDVDIQDQAEPCTAPMSLLQLEASLKHSDNMTLSLTPKQQATVARLTQAANGALFYQVIGALSQSTTAPLQARYQMTRTISMALPPNQWQIETQYWFTLMLAYLQQVSLQVSTGQFAASTDYINVTRPSQTDPVQNAAYEICQNQIVLSSSYQNFNFFALLLTVSLCAVIILLGLTIEDVVGFIRQRRLHFTEHDGKQDMWTLNSDLEMLKTISEFKNGTVWTRSKNSIPLAQPGCKARIFELASDTLRAEAGKGIVHRRTEKSFQQESPVKNFSRTFKSEDCTACTTFQGSNHKDSSRVRKLHLNHHHHRHHHSSPPERTTVSTTSPFIYDDGIPSSHYVSDVFDRGNGHSHRAGRPTQDNDSNDESESLNPAPGDVGLPYTDCNGRYTFRNGFTNRLPIGQDRYGMF